MGDQRQSSGGVPGFRAFFDETSINVHGYRKAKAVHQTQNVSEMIIIGGGGGGVILLVGW